jgi:hypothetical protein
MAWRTTACRIAGATLLVALAGAATGCGGTAATSAPARPPNGSVTAAAPAAETTAPPKTSTCQSLAPEVVRIAGTGDSAYPEITGIDKTKVVADRQADYTSGALKVPAGTAQVAVLTCRGTAVWDDKSTTGLRFELSYDVNGNRSVAYQRT